MTLLSKDRIMEIYLNVIEYGPNLYGIGPASWHFFSKPPKDRTPVEAAFSSTILFSPKERFKQYCAGTLTKWTTGKIQRSLAIMLERDRLRFWAVRMYRDAAVCSTYGSGTRTRSGMVGAVPRGV